MLEKMERYTSEVANRLGIALSEAGGTVSMGAELLQKYAAETEKTGEKLGFEGVADLLKTDPGKAFLAAAATFNKHKADSPKDKAALENAAKKWVDFLTDDPRGKAAAVQRMVMAAARTCLLGMELLQWLAAAKDLPGWAGKLKPQKGLQPENVQKWLRQPSDKSRLVAALVASYPETPRSAIWEARIWKRRFRAVQHRRFDVFKQRRFGAGSAVWKRQNGAARSAVLWSNLCI